MCKEDIRIMRQTRTRTKTASAAAAPVSVLPANPDRVAVTLALASQDFLTSTVTGNVDPATGNVVESITTYVNQLGQLGIMDGTVFCPLMCANDAHPVDRVHIDQIGAVLCQELFYRNLVGLTTVCTIVESSFTREIGDL